MLFKEGNIPVHLVDTLNYQMHTNVRLYQCHNFLSTGDTFTAAQKSG